MLLGADPPVRMTRRAVGRLARQRELAQGTVHPGGTVIHRDGRGELRWWTWAGYRANSTLAVTLTRAVDTAYRFDDRQIRLCADLTPQRWRDLTAGAEWRLCLPAVDPRAVAGLKFSAALPARLAEATVAARLADLDGAAAVLREPVHFVHGS